MAQSLVAHMPGPFVDLLRSDMVLEGGQPMQLGEPVQLGGTNKDQVTDEAIAGARMWLLSIVCLPVQQEFLASIWSPMHSWLQTPV